jgi:hypothetical protein
MALSGRNFAHVNTLVKNRWQGCNIYLERIALRFFIGRRDYEKNAPLQ